MKLRIKPKCIGEFKNQFVDAEFSARADGYFSFFCCYYIAENKDPRMPDFVRQLAVVGRRRERDRRAIRAPLGAFSVSLISYAFTAIIDLLRET